MPAKFSVLAVVATPLLPFLLACGGDDDGGGGGGTTDASMSTDAPAQMDAALNCTASATYSPTIGADNSQVDDVPAMGQTPHQQYLDALINNDQMPDQLEIALVAGRGAFTGGDIKTGTFQLDTALTSCGACGLLITDVAGQNQFADFYFATSGTLTLTSVETNLTGTLTNVTFQHVMKDAMGRPTNTPADDCTSTIASVAFDLPLPAAASGDSSARRIILQPLKLTQRAYK